MKNAVNISPVRLILSHTILAHINLETFLKFSVSFTVRWRMDINRCTSIQK